MSRRELDDLLQSRLGFDEGPNPGELTVRPGSDVGVELEAVPGAGTQLPGCSAGWQLLGYRVRLEVAADA